MLIWGLRHDSQFIVGVPVCGCVPDAAHSLQSLAVSVLVLILVVFVETTKDKNLKGLQQFRPSNCVPQNQNAISLRGRNICVWCATAHAARTSTCTRYLYRYYDLIGYRVFDTVPGMTD